MHIYSFLPLRPTKGSTYEKDTSCDNLLESQRKIWHPALVITDGFTAVDFILRAD